MRATNHGDEHELSARQRGMLEVELRRAAGYRAVAAMAVLGFVAMIGLNSAPTVPDMRSGGLHTESYGFEAPASAEEEFRRETIAVAPATDVYEAPDRIVHHEAHG